MTLATRNQLLEKGRQRFALQGLEGARVDLIAAEAGVNKALISYHFRGKAGLYSAVLRESFQALADDLRAAQDPAAPPAARLYSWPSLLWTVLDRHPDFAPLFLRELLAGGRHLPGEPIAAAASGLESLTSILAEGSRRGALRAAPPYSLHLLILGGVLLARAAGPLSGRLAAALPAQTLRGGAQGVVPLLAQLLEGGLGLPEDASSAERPSQEGET